jgi:hypothetical protein
VDGNDQVPRGSSVWQLAVLCAALLLTACGGPGLYLPGRSSRVTSITDGGTGEGRLILPASEPSTTWDRTISGLHRDGTVPLETALHAWDVAV